jgi:hypothetical protein
MDGSDAAGFTVFCFPTGEAAWVPADIELKLPEITQLAVPDAHYLIYIPWHDQYLDRVDPAWRDFFRLVLPYLHARSTDIHVMTCLPFIQDLTLAVGEPMDERVVRIAFILHDAGWSQMSDLEIAHSLGVQGLSLSGKALDPKARHALLGEQLALQILDQHPLDPPLSEAQKKWIGQAILFHDKPWELAVGGDISVGMKIVCDVDHLWSFTHPNFWQDTLRKKVEPVLYLQNLGRDLEGYFVTPAGRSRAHQLLELRREEVNAWQEWALSHPLHASGGAGTLPGSGK